MLADTESDAREIDSFCASAVQLLPTGWRKRKGCRRDLLSAAVLLVCMPADQESERAGCFPFVLPPFTSYGPGGWRGRGAGVSLLSAATALACIPANCESECTFV